MSRKKLIYIAACAELCLGTYFMLGFLAWLVKMFLLNPGHKLSSGTITIWLVLAAVCFWLYTIAWRKMKEIEKDSPPAPTPDETTQQKLVHEPRKTIV